MDHGTLTDTNGRQADFRHIILVMTSNAGAGEIVRNSIGFSTQDNSHDGLEVIKSNLVLNSETDWMPLLTLLH